MGSILPTMSTMSAFSIRFQPEADDALLAEADAIVQRFGARVTWEQSPACKRTYGLVESADAACASALREATRAAVLDRPIIALAITPSLAEALPPLLHALGGPGRPAGVLSCEAIGGAAIVEWDLDATAIDVVLGLVDIEIARFRARRVNALLTPLPLQWWTRIAASGLRSPDITVARVLEEQLEVHGVLD
jgi:hypothetical protein